MRRSPKLECLYSEAFLKEIRKEAERELRTTPGDLAFASFTSGRIAALFDDLRFDCMAVSLLKLVKDWELGDINCVQWNLPKHVVGSYEKHSSLDETSRSVYINTGRIVRTEDIYSDDDAWLNNEFYRKHCYTFGLRRAMMVAFRHPTHDRTMVSFDFFAYPGNHSWLSANRTVLEFGTFPFALAWLYRKGAMDDRHLEHFFELLHSSTLGELSYLRKYVNSPHQTLEEQAKDLGVQHNTLKSGLYSLRDKLAPRSPWYALNTGSIESRKSLRVLDADYSFLRLLGDHTKPLIAASA